MTLTTHAIDGPTRRDAFAVAAAALAVGWSTRHSGTQAAEGDEAGTIGLGFSLYGMKSLPVDEALKACHEIGYDCVELPVQADWPLDVRTLSSTDRRRVRQLLRGHDLRLSALMENLNLLGDAATHGDNLERLRRCGQLAHDLSPAGPAIIETILGGRPAQWEEIRQRMAERLGDWARVAEAAGATVAIKPHVSGAMHRPEHALWLLEQVGSRAIRCAYDYSHYRLRGIDMAASIQQLVPHAVFIHVKDARGDADRVQFLLPGEGDIDYARYLSLVHKVGYRGDVVVEVSGQIFNRPTYDPIFAARKSYRALAKAFQQSGVPRR